MYKELEPFNIKKKSEKKRVLFTLQFLRSTLRVGGSSQWKRSMRRARYSAPLRGFGRVLIQEITKGSHPSWDGSIKIIPHRLTVAGYSWLDDGG